MVSVAYCGKDMAELDHADKKGFKSSILCYWNASTGGVESCWNLSGTLYSGVGLQGDLLYKST